MPLTRQGAANLLVAIVAAASLGLNPNYQARDFKDPAAYIRKVEHDRGYDGSGLVYGFSAGVLGVCGLAFVYNVLTGQFYRRRDD